MKEYKFIAIGTTEELNTIEKAINNYLVRNYSATPKHLKSGIDSITFSVSLALMWGESFETILTRALRKGLKGTKTMYSNNWIVDVI